MADALYEAGFYSAEEVSQASIEDLIQIRGIGEETAKKLIEGARLSLEAQEKDDETVGDTEAQDTKTDDAADETDTQETEADDAADNTVAQETQADEPSKAAASDESGADKAN